MLKKTLAAAAAAVLALTLAACGSDAAAPAAPTTPATTSAPAGETTAAPAGSETPAMTDGSETPAMTDGSETAAAPADGELPETDMAVLKGAKIAFAQVGSESGWRTANSDDIQATAKDLGVDLSFTSAEQDQAKQIAAIQTAITQKVDVIAFSPVVTTGWDAVLEEAKAAGIPVILTDRGVDADPSLYTTFIGSDFVLEGEKAGKWAQKEFADATEVNYVVLEGSTGADPAIDRAKGWDNILGSETKFKKLASQTGEFTRDEGKKVMESFLSKYPKIDLVYAHNDDMGLGAIEAIEAAGKKPGVDIKIVTVDAVKAGMQALAAGKINYIVECSPLLGAQLFQAAAGLINGATLPKRVITKESEFDQAQAVAALPDRKY